jgi:hypothetical protein
MTTRVYEPPALEVLGSVSELTQQKGGASPDSLKGNPDTTDFPSGFCEQNPEVCGGGG